MKCKTARTLAIPFLATALVAGAQDYSTHTGAELYKRFCVSCHGAAGKGDGPVGKLLVVKPPDLSRIAARRAGVFPEAALRRIIDGRDVMTAHGGRDMPVWGTEFSRLETSDAAGARTADSLIDRLVSHLRTLQVP